MKKILGILGVTLLIAVSFFNMSSVVDANQNVDLASIIQNASADDEYPSESGPAIYREKKQVVTADTQTYWKQITNPRGNGWLQVTCSTTDYITSTQCLGSGSVRCTPTEEVEEGEEDCWY